MKNFIIYILIVVIITLFYLIFNGSFCHCECGTCPTRNSLRSENA